MNTSYGFFIMFDFYDKLFTIYRFVIALFDFLGVVVSNVVHSNTTFEEFSYFYLHVIYNKYVYHRYS